MEEELEKTWIDLMIEREATPKALRKETTVDFLKEHDVASSTYYRELSHKDNQEKILNICLSLAKRYTPEIMENLGERATKDNKAAELFMDYVLKLSKNLDIKTDGESLNLYSDEQRSKIAKRILENNRPESEGTPD